MISLRSRLWIVPVVLLVAGVARGEDLRVMSFNIRYDNPLDGENAWPNRREIFFATIEKFAPDLLGMQEVRAGQEKEIRERLKTYEIYGVPRDDTYKSERSTIAFKRDRFEKVRAGDFWMSETPDTPGSKGWDADLPRICSWVELRDKQSDNRPIFFFNAHWDHKGRTARLESAKLMRKRIIEIAGDNPVIITGDFNAGQDQQPYRELLGERFFDSFVDITPKPTTRVYTFHGFTGTNNQSSARIDWLLRSNAFRTKEAEIHKYNENGRYPSDHFPIVAVFEWAGEKPPQTHPAP